MKAILMAFILLGCAVIAKGQLAHTKWSGVMTVPTPTDVVLDFKSDTVNMIIKDSNYVGETMTYSVKNNIITMKKVDGHSPCDGTPFTVTFTLKDDHLTILTLSDKCDARSASWPSDPFIKEKNKTVAVLTFVRVLLCTTNITNSIYNRLYRTPGINLKTKAISRHRLVTYATLFLLSTAS